MFNTIKCFLAGKRIIEVNGNFIPQVYEISAGWCGIDVKLQTWAALENIDGRCRYSTFQEANDQLQNYLDYQAKQKVLEKQKIHPVQSVPQFWRILRNKND